jgi:hypothetical protein
LFPFLRSLKISKTILILESLSLGGLLSVIFRNGAVCAGIFGGILMGLVHVLSISLAIENLKLAGYFIKTFIKFIVILFLFFVLVRYLKVNPFAVLGGFFIPLIAMVAEVIRCRQLKKQ